MGALLVCDAPDCFHTMPAVVIQGRPAAPKGWWMQIGKNERLIVACCDKHLELAAKLGVSRL